MLNASDSEKFLLQPGQNNIVGKIKYAQNGYTCKSSRGAGKVESLICKLMRKASLALSGNN